MDPRYTDRLLATVKTAAAIGAAPAVEDPQTVLHRVYSAIILGDYEALRESMTEDVELVISGFGPLDGTWRGVNDMVAATRKNFAEVESQQPEIEGMISQGENVAVFMRESGVLKTSGQAYSIRAVQWYQFSGGKIKRIEEIVASVGKDRSRSLTA